MMNTNWDLRYLCENKEKWDQLVEDLSVLIQELKVELETCDSVSKLEHVLKRKIQMNQQIEVIYCYPRRMLDLDSSNTSAQEMFDVAFQKYLETQKIDSLFEQKVQEQRKLVKQFLKIHPYYQRYFDLLNHNVDHAISNQDVYDGLQKQSNILKEIYQAFVRQDLDFGVIEDESGNMVKATPVLLQRMSESTDQTVRARAYEITMKAYQRVENMLSTIYQNKLKTELGMAHNQNFETVLESHLFQDELPDHMISNLIETVRKNLDVQHQFMSLKKERMGLAEFHIYDVGKTSFPSESRDISLGEARTIIQNMTSILGPDYQKRLSEAFSDGWLDLGLSKTKRKDSFSCITYSGVPYTMLQYKNKIDSVRILSHELGHAIHTSYAKENDFEYFEYPLFLAEIASKVHEALFYNYMLEQSSEEEKQYLLEHMLGSFCTSLFSQTMLTEFEHTVFDNIQSGKRVDATYLNHLYRSLVESYYGDSLVVDELVGCNWTKISHFFLYPSYYVFEYATGVAIANKIAFDLILDQNHMREKYIEFLKVGNRKSIKDALQIVGIDLDDSTYIDDACAFVKVKMKILK